MSWPQRRLDELGLVSRGRSRHRPRNDPSLYGGAYPFVQTGDVKHAEFYITSHTQTYNDAGLAQSRMWPAGTLCITIAANIADTAILSYDACFPDSVIGFIPHEGVADVRFVKYFFSIVQERYRRVAQGAAQDNLNQQKLLSFSIPAPDIQVQRRIADILSAYDDLIENNRRRMDLLEESIHLLYREWFVYLRFPGHERAEISDGVPEGWTRAPGKLAINFNPRTPIPKGRSRPYVPMGSLSTDSMRINDIQERVPKGGAKFRNGDTLLARITPCLENGKTGFVQFMDTSDDVASGSTEFIVMRGATVPPSWVYCLARSPDFRQEAINRMSGSDGRQRVDWKALAEVEILIPSAGIAAEFDRVADEVFREIRLLNKHNEKLREARDLLLPRLMDGRIPV